MINLDGLVEGLIGFGIIIGLTIWGIVSLISWIFWSGDDAIRVEEPITPEIELVIKPNNVIDTIYVYKQP